MKEREEKEHVNKQPLWLQDLRSLKPRHSAIHFQNSDIPGEL
jgi:hypothetical protein